MSDSQEKTAQTSAGNRSREKASTATCDSQGAKSERGAGSGSSRRSRHRRRKKKRSGRPDGARSDSQNRRGGQQQNRRGGRNRKRRRGRPGQGSFAVTGEKSPAAGVVEVLKDGTGYLRRLEYNYSVREDDVFVPATIIRKFGMLEGYRIQGQASPSQNKRSRRMLVDVETIEGLKPDAPELENRGNFKDGTSLDPTEKFQLATGTTDPSLRLLDLLTPIGKGQRGLLVAPPRTGKTILLQRLAQSISRNHPGVHLIVVLVDERPEEATEWKRSVSHGEVISSTSDEMAGNHVNLAEIAIERAKRLVELRQDVVVLLDSLTRLARAYNLETKNSGRTLSGGVDVRTLTKPKSFFGAARNVEEGGSLTILSTALIETGSRMDQVIFEEFKGTGNMELVLSRKLADLRIFPAFDIHLSGTRKEEKLIPEHLLNSVWALRRVLQKVDPVEGMRILIKKISETESNEQFLGSFNQAAVD